MSAAEVFLGAHINVVVLGVVQDTFQALVGWYTDGTWRKAGMLVSIIRRIHFQVLEHLNQALEIIITAYYATLIKRYSDRMVDELMIKHT